jgi:hypothetical protein
MKRLLTAILFLLSGATIALALVNPHDRSDPDRCISCHTQEVTTQECSEIDGYCLRNESIDGMCLLCHKKSECCTVGQEHDALDLGHSHPSDLDEARVAKKHRPRTLPTHNGLITCNTCHLHEKPDTPDHMLVRIVRITEKGVDWTGLCADCHDEYL